MGEGKRQWVYDRCDAAISGHFLASKPSKPIFSVKSKQQFPSSALLFKCPNILYSNFVHFWSSGRVVLPYYARIPFMGKCCCLFCIRNPHPRHGPWARDHRNSHTKLPTCTGCYNNIDALNNPFTYYFQNQVGPNVGPSEV